MFSGEGAVACAAIGETFRDEAAVHGGHRRTSEPELCGEITARRETITTADPPVHDPLAELLEERGGTPTLRDAVEEHVDAHWSANLATDWTFWQTINARTVMS